MVDDNYIVNVILDMDTIDTDDKINRLVKNIKYLQQEAKEVIVITQNVNLEDELIRSLPNIKNEQQLLEFFKEKSLAEYKSRLAQMNERNLKQKLKDIDYNSFWCDTILNSYTNSKVTSVNKTIKDVHKNK